MLAAIETGRSSLENTSWIEPEDAECFLAVNEHPSTYRHKLQQSPIFTLENLIALGERLPDDPRSDRGRTAISARTTAGMPGRWSLYRFIARSKVLPKTTAC